MTRAHRVWLETCRGCSPWTRVVEHQLTREPVVQTMHEPGCNVFPMIDSKADVA